MTEGIEEDEIVVLGAGDPEKEGIRAQLRRRWELASVLNFLRVFRSVIGGKLNVTGEEVEEGLIFPDDVLARIHVALLKGIPPVSKNVEAPDVWMTLVCKQMDLWWSWVGEGDAPISENRGAEIYTYRKLDSLSRLLILKALCEIRAVQDDIIAFIDETLKNGSPLNTFRKDKIGTDSQGNDYWWDGDSIIGFRLYRERIVAGPKQNFTVGTHAEGPSINCQWETVACDLDQFEDVSVKLSESKACGDTAVAEILKTEVIPLVEKMQKKKERALKRQQREILHLRGHLGLPSGSRRSCRDRKPARYTFDEFDRTIEEALEIQRKPNVVDAHAREHTKVKTTQHKVVGDEKTISSGSEDEDYDDEDDELESNGHSDESCDGGSEVESKLDHSPAQQKKHSKMIDTTGLRRSMRNTSLPSQPLSAESNGHAETKKRLRQKPVHNTDYTNHAISDSEDSDNHRSVDGKATKNVISDSEDSDSHLLVDDKAKKVLMHSVSDASPPTTAVR